MMASTTHFCRNSWIERAWRALCLAVSLVFCAPGLAQTVTEISQYQVERVDDEVLLSAQLAFDLPTPVEDALLKGIPMFFVMEAELLRERWYWYDKKLRVVERHMRLAYQPLTRRWRLSASAGPGRDTLQGVTLNQSFDTLTDALAAVKRVSRWKIAEVPELDGNQKLKVDFRFRLDLSQLPRPFQIGTLGQSDWDLIAMATTALSLAAPK
jgi:hypothetical protein